jgi:hypothetical protein
MIILVNGGPALDRFGPSKFVGRFVAPRSGHIIRPGEVYACDNDVLKAWDEDRYIRMLNRLAGVPGCLFVTAPDCVTMTPTGPLGDARVTVERFWDWRQEITGRGFPVALVGQDGAEDLDLPWDAFDAWFIGGSTEWKLSASSYDLVCEAKQRNKWIHMGRCNTQRRLKIAYDMGCDSVDGTGWSMFPDKYMLRDLPFLEALHRQPLLF